MKQGLTFLVYEPVIGLSIYFMHATPLCAETDTCTLVETSVVTLSSVMSGQVQPCDGRGLHCGLLSVMSSDTDMQAKTWLPAMDGQQPSAFKARAAYGSLSQRRELGFV